MEICPLDVEEGQDWPWPLLASSEQGLGAAPCHPRCVCGLLVEAKNDVGTSLWGTELPAAGLDVVFLGH